MPRQEESVRELIQQKFTFTPALRARVDRLLRWIFLTCAVVAIASFIVEYGFFPSDFLRQIVHIAQALIILIFCLMPLAQLLFTHQRLTWIKEHLAELIVVAVYVVYLLVSSPQSGGDIPSVWSGGDTGTPESLLGGQLFIAANLIIRFIRGNRTLVALAQRPVRSILLTFLAVIGVGTLLLSLPRATVSGQIHPIDALFTATSATCVTGLTVVDTGSYFTRFGQSVIMGLIQIGGLGLMSFTAFFSTILGIRLARKEIALYSHAYEADALSTVRRLLVYMLLATLLIELLGFGLLYKTWEPKYTDQSQLLFSSAFHSIAAFCNAGFSLNADNLEPHVSSVGTSMIISSLIILGGLGFVVLMNLTSLRRRHKKGQPQSRLNLQTKLVLAVTAILILVGWIAITPLEWSNSMQGLGVGEKIAAGYFQSVTTRTAGFNTIPTDALRSGTLFVMVVLMFIGASPGSTGGGIKTSTFAVIILNFWANLRGKSRVEVFKREIPSGVIKQALTVLVGGLAFVVTGFFILLLLEDQPPLDILFETVSAWGTVGLSAGITGDLSYAGRIVIILLMFAGRVGPLSLGLAIGKKRGEAHYSYPEGRIGIG
ncbi:MAG: TrkH family potassium uptake protein [bacterium]|nr:TrkH family potassium uptake protein [bacterium]